MEETQLSLFDDHIPFNTPTVDPDYGDAYTIDARYRKWIEVNPHVKTLAAKRAFALKRAGHKQYKLRVILGVLQYDHDVTASKGSFSINHDYTSRLARDIMDTWPELEGFFQVRQLKS